MDAACERREKTDRFHFCADRGQRSCVASQRSFRLPCTKRCHARMLITKRRAKTCARQTHERAQASTLHDRAAAMAAASDTAAPGESVRTLMGLTRLCQRAKFFSHAAEAPCTTSVHFGRLPFERTRRPLRGRKRIRPLLASWTGGGEHNTWERALSCSIKSRGPWN